VRLWPVQGSRLNAPNNPQTCPPIFVADSTDYATNVIDPVNFPANADLTSSPFDVKILDLIYKMRLLKSEKVGGLLYFLTLNISADLSAICVEDFADYTD
jgi:hypothetical protein